MSSDLSRDRNITEREQDREALRRLSEEQNNREARVREARRLEALGVLARSIAHDFNNLLTGILGHANLAALRLSQDHPAREHIHQIEQISLQAADLIKQIMVEAGKNRLDALAVPVAALPASPAVPDKGAGMVLVADDMETARLVCRRILESAGFDVVLAADGQELLDIYQQRGREICLILLDLTMPGLGGEETFHRLRTLDPDVKVILVSGHGEQEATRMVAGRGLTGFVQKPFRASGLIAAVQEALKDDRVTR